MGYRSSTPFRQHVEQRVHHTSHMKDERIIYDALMMKKKKKKKKNHECQS
jgi:hypothetical protein